MLNITYKVLIQEVEEKGPIGILEYKPQGSIKMVLKKQHSEM
jgi:hypothetical protein